MKFYTIRRAVFVQLIFTPLQFRSTFDNIPQNFVYRPPEQVLLITLRFQLKLRQKLATSRHHTRPK